MVVEETTCTKNVKIEKMRQSETWPNKTQHSLWKPIRKFHKEELIENLENHMGRRKSHGKKNNTANEKQDSRKEPKTTPNKLKN